VKSEGRTALSALKELTEEGTAAGVAEGLSAEQAVQEAEYEFPYHYIPRLEGGNFSQVRKLRWGYEYLSYLRFVLARLERAEFDSLLDVGCGEGRFLREVSRRFQGKRLLGVDFSARAVEYARLLNPGLRFTREDIADGVEPPERFDVVTLIETLEHVPPVELREFVGGLRRRVNEGGLLVVSVPSKNIKMSAKHYQHFDLDSLKTALAPRFEVAEHYHLNRISKWDRLISAVLTNRYFILNERRLLNALFRRYERSLLAARESDCKRLCVVCRPA
jgi:SAM-dependent methyltransferase